MAQNIAGEIKLLQASIKGSNEAFEKLVCKYQSLVCAITYSATGDIEKSEELAHETFIRAWKNLTQLRDQSRFKFWLCSIAKSTIKNYLRNRKRDIIHKAGVITNAEEISCPSPAPSQNLIAKEQQAVVDKALQSIPESYRQPLILFYRQEQSVSQVAEQLELSENNVRTRLSRGRKILKKQVVRMIENSLSGTGPGKAFTAAVMGSVASIAVKGTAAAAAVTTGSVSAAGTAGISVTTIMSGTAAKIITAAAVAAVAVSGVITYKNLNKKRAVVPAIPIAKPAQKEPELAETQTAAKNQAETDYLKVEDTGENLHQKQIQETGKTAVNNTENRDSAKADIIEAFDGSTITLKVIDRQTAEPIPNAPIRTYTGVSNYYKTDRDGVYTVKIPKGEKSINLFAQPAGYVWQSFTCGTGRFTDYFPEEVVFALDKGIVVGGVVHDPNGNPLEGAEVSLRCTNGLNDENPDIDLRFKQKTGPDGRWQCISAPEDLVICTASASHPEYAAASAEMNDKNVSDQLREQTHVLTLKNGFSISGTVTDETGNPIEGGRIQLGHWYGASERASRTHTDMNGYYEFTNRNNGRTYATVTAGGFAPEVKIATIKDESAVVDFVLTKGSPVYGRVLDTAGKGIAGAMVRADDWRYAFPNEIRSLDWNTKTDNEGRFIWEHAPEGIVKFAISKAEFMTFKTPDVTPSDTEYKFVLYDKLRTSGRVIDAVSKEPITEFIFRRHEGGYISSPKKIMDADGKFSTAFDDQGEKYTISFKADGYSPKRSREIFPGEQDVELLVEMTPGAGIEGVIVDANGMPLESAGVIIPRGVLHLDNMNYDHSRRRYHHFTKTDDQGRFHFNPIGHDRYSLLVLHEDGYVYTHAEDFPEDGRFVLQPYAKIAGDYYQSGVPVANEHIRIDYPDYLYRQIEDNYNIGSLAINDAVQTDKDGKFVFEKLIHGTVRILVDPYKNVKIKAGETKEVYIGGDGLTVKGRVTDPNGNPLNEKFGHCSLTFQRIHDRLPIPEDQLPLPDNADAMSYAEFAAWFTEFGGSDQGRQWLAAMEQQYDNLTGFYSFKIDYNGHFEKPNVKPGMYLFTVSVKPWQDEKSRPEDRPKLVDHDGGYIAKASKVIVVPEFQTFEEMAVPIDIGTLQCRKALLEVGMKAPDFEVEGLKSAGRIRLSDYRGKTVLVNFTNPARQEYEPDQAAELNQLCTQVNALGSITIINIAMEILPWDYTRNKMTPLCTLPGIYGVGQLKIFFDYEPGEMPHSVLICPVGKILWKGTPGDELLDLLIQP